MSEIIDLKDGETVWFSEYLSSRFPFTVTVTELGDHPKGVDQSGKKRILRHPNIFDRNKVDVLKRKRDELSDAIEVYQYMIDKIEGLID